MAKELRVEILAGTLAAGTAAFAADSEFRNDSSGIIHIRRIRFNSTCATTNVAEQSTIEISKSPTIASLTNNNVFWTFPQDVGGVGIISGAVTEGSTTWNNVANYGRGQLTLEPNESLFVNCSKSSGITQTYQYVIEYEFG